MRQQDRGTHDETQLEVRVREDPLRTWVTPIGELDLSNADVFDRQLWEAQITSRRVVLDLRALEFIDSTGLRSVIAGRLRAVEWHHHLDVICGPGQVRRMLALSGHKQLIQIIDPVSPQSHGQLRAAA